MTKRSWLTILIAVEVVAILVIASALWFVGQRKVEPVAVNETCTVQDSGIDWLEQGGAAEMLPEGGSGGDSVSYQFSDVVVDMQCPGLGYAIAYDAVPVTGGAADPSAEPGSVLALFIDGIPVEQQYDVMRIGGVERVSAQEIRVRYEMNDGSEDTWVTYSLDDLVNEDEAPAVDPTIQNVAGEEYAPNAASPTGHNGTGVRDVRIKVTGSNVHRYFVCGLRVPRPTKVYVNNRTTNNNRTTINNRTTNNYASPDEDEKSTTPDRDGDSRKGTEEPIEGPEDDEPLVDGPTQCTTAGTVPSWLKPGRTLDISTPRGATETSSSSSSTSSTTSTSPSSTTTSRSSSPTSTTSTSPTTATTTTTTPPAVVEPPETSTPAPAQVPEAVTPAAPAGAGPVDVEVAPLASSSSTGDWKVRLGTVTRDIECEGLSWARAANSTVVVPTGADYSGPTSGSVIVFMIDGKVAQSSHQLVNATGVQRVDEETVRVQYSSGSVTYTVKDGKLSSNGSPGSAVIANLQ